ncbi:MAG: hypothetical protein HKN72_02590 [Gemmatimonadetes bacterium]|nr:hypothetical protein [Gemmatimonadota bacterium]
MLRGSRELRSRSRPGSREEEVLDTDKPKRPIWPIIRRIWITLGVGVTVIFVTWSLIAYRASSAAQEATVSADGVTVRHAAGIWTFSATGVPDDAARLVFFPGALVDPRAYAPLAQAVAREGYVAEIVELPRRGAFGGAESPELAERVRTTLASRGERAIVVGGHSKGGVVASRVAADFGASLNGLLLIGTSHPRDVDLSDIAVPVTKVVGTRDGLASPDEVRANASLLPEHTRWVWIEGGNHSQFGWYGFQPMDRRPRLSASEQRLLMVEAILGLMKSVSASDSTESGGYDTAAAG